MVTLLRSCWVHCEKGAQKEKTFSTQGGLGGDRGGKNIRLKGFLKDIW